MAEQTLESLIKQLLCYNKGFAPFLWHGGEPLLAGIEFYKMATEYQKKYLSKNHKIRNLVQTNGTLINDEWIDFFYKNNFAIGISIDGPKEIHEKFRPNSFDHVFENIRRMKAKGLSFGAICVVNSNNVNYPNELYKFFKTYLCDSINIKPCIEMEGCYLSEYSVKPMAYAAFMNDIFDIWFRDDNPAFMIRQFQNIIMAFLGAEPILCVNKSSACQKFITINHNGDVFSCDAFVGENYKDFLYGNILNCGFKELFTTSNAIALLQMQQAVNLRCSKCRWVNICGGGCTNFQVHLSDKYREEYCNSRKAMFEHIHSTLSSLNKVC